MSERTPELVVLLLVVLLAGTAVLLGSGDVRESKRPEAAQVSRAHIALISRRVETLRGLRFRRPVPVAIVSPAQARRVAIAEYDRTQPVAQQRTNEELLKLLGLVPADMGLREIVSTLYGEQVAGFYDPRRDRLALVRGAGVDDITLAHELTHALEDQHVDLARLGSGGTADDRATAEQALVEGTATAVMERYAARWPSEAPLGDALAGLTQVTDGTPLPSYILRSMIFPYIQGETFVEALLDADRGDWGLVDVALRARPPQTSAEILDPDRWLRAEQPLPVSLRGAAPPRAGGWRRVAGSTLGAEDLAALLAPENGPAVARSVTAGWRGGRYALWRRGPLVDADCPAPCRRRDALVMAVRMDNQREAHALGIPLNRWLSGRLGARVVGLAPWRMGDGAYAATYLTPDAVVRVALAPSEALARRLVVPR